MLFTNKIFFPTSKKGLWYLARAIKNRRKQLINGFKLRFASKIESSPAEAIAIQYVLKNEHVTSAIFGTTQQENIEKNVACLQDEVAPEIFDRINATKLPYQE
jgi:aryl-alcohol dehydrogenase-like predicted oxidoreductase